MKIQDGFTVASAFAYKIKNQDGSELSIHPGDVVKIKLTDGRAFTGYTLSDTVEAFRNIIIYADIVGRLSISWRLIAEITILGRKESEQGAWDISKPILLERPKVND